jgi:DNA-binding ferritin-like protein (Dps family)
MRGLTKFVEEYKGFVKWLDRKDKELNEYVQRFEKIFSVTTETELLREIQDMKDELNMLSAVFNDQKSVLKKVGENIEASRAALLAKSKELVNSKDDMANGDSGERTNAPHVEASAPASRFRQQSGNHASVTTESVILRQFQDMKDEFNNMLSATFNDQKSVLSVVGKNIKDSYASLLSGDSDGTTKAELVESSLSAFSFQQQSDKHARHIKRMQDQANQAYANVSVCALYHTLLLTHILISFGTFWTSNNSKRTYWKHASIGTSLLLPKSKTKQSWFSQLLPSYS